MPKDYYKVLGVPRDATGDEIKAAYRKLAKQHHPDVAGGEDPERIKEINEAYSVLGDPDKRANHDRGGDIPRGWGAFGGPGGFNIFFGGGPVFANRGPHPPPPLELSVSLGLGEVFRGAVKEVEYERPSQCRACGGSGAKEGKVQVCMACRGLGVNSSFAGAFVGACLGCGGLGHVPAQPCGECSRGWRNERQRISLTIPRGMKPQGVIRVSGAGTVLASGQQGDLFLRIAHAPHRFFEESFPDLCCSLPLTLSDAVFGCEAVVPSFHGRIMLKVAAGTAHGTILRVPGKGLPRGPSEDSFGDLLVRVEPEIPRAVRRGDGLHEANLAYTKVTEYLGGLDALAEELQAGGGHGSGE